MDHVALEWIPVGTLLLEMTVLGPSVCVTPPCTSGARVCLGWSPQDTQTQHTHPTRNACTHNTRAHVTHTAHTCTQHTRNTHAHTQHTQQCTHNIHNTIHTPTHMHTRTRVHTHYGLVVKSMGFRNRIPEPRSWLSPISCGP